MSVKLRMKYLSGGRKSLYLDIYHNGKRHYDFLKLILDQEIKVKKEADKDIFLLSKQIKVANSEKLLLAETIRANRESELQFADHDIIPSFKRNADFVQYFQKLGEGKGRSSMIWKAALNHLRAFTGGKVAFKNINELWLERFQSFLMEQLSRNTASGHFGKVRSALKLALRDKIIPRNPCENVRSITLEETERQYLTFEEIKKLSETIPEAESSKKVCRMFLFACFTGLSIANLETLTFEQIEVDTVKFFRYKTKTWQYVPLSKTALSLIGNTDNSAPNLKIFNIPKRRQCSYILEKWGKQAGIKKHVHMHLARHSFATLSLTQGADLYTVSKLLGHKKIQTTQIYGKVIDEKKRQAVDALPQLEV
ncbi:MAG TPA: site-specific integrase [Candidatus Lambdaproteobacteria bacterium]|nr:site-specific integrase [Candidatus Lambdaproteobacteria bacterium]